jgi:citrate lyase subunit beta/citryl-CoA lyase/(S)-citramalyl-CoA lyase
MPLRSLLFVPGTRPERFDKAISAGADAVCIDLEDAVPVHAKAEARKLVAAFLAARAGGGTRVGVRINSLLTADGARDLAALADLEAPPSLVMIPKVASAAELAVVSGALNMKAPCLWPIVESALGLRDAWSISAAPGVEGVLFGAVDLAADLGVQPTWEPMLFARGRLAAACAAASVELLDVPSIDIDDDDALRESTLKARAFGFTGRACIHPRQVPVVNASFAPTDVEIAHARRVVRAFEDAKGAAVQLDGKMVELPIIRSARRILAAAGEN